MKVSQVLDSHLTGVKFSLISLVSQDLMYSLNYPFLLGDYVYLLSLLNEESGIMEFPTQKRKRVENPSISSSKVKLKIKVLEL